MTYPKPRPWSKGHKYRAKRVSLAGYSFASKLEASVFSLLQVMESTGAVSEIKHQHTVYLTKARIGYRADFRIFDNEKNRYTLVESKGFPTEVWQIKLKLYRVYGEFPLWIFKGSHGKPYFDEEVIPDGIKEL